jgi:cold shock CspA family protein
VELSREAGTKKGRIQPMAKGTGTIKWYDHNKGFGFITADDGSEDLFLHYTGISSGGYAAVQGRRGGMRAENVSKV